MSDYELENLDFDEFVSYVDYDELEEFVDDDSVSANSFTESQNTTIQNLSNDIHWYFRTEVDYLDITGTGYYYTPSLELTMANNDLNIVDNQLICSTEVSTCLLLNHLIDDNFYLQRMTFIGTTIQALLLFIISVPKLRELGRRIVGGKKNRGVQSS